MGGNAMFPFFFFDPTMFILIPGILLAIYAQAKIRGTFNRYSKIAARSGMTGAQVAKRLLENNQIYDIAVEQTPGKLSDHYDPTAKVLRLSPEVYNSNSLSALGVAAHEVGHVMQHQFGYAAFSIRNAIVPIANIGSYAAFPLLILGLFMGIPQLVQIGVIAFGAAVLFQLVTLPVEFNASSRAIHSLEMGGYLIGDEVTASRKVLNAAALTYVAATVMALLQFLRLLLLSGILGGRRSD